MNSRRSFVDAFEDVVVGFSSMFGANSWSFCDLEAPDYNMQDANNPDYAIASKDGSLVSLIRIEGSLQMVGATEFSGMISRLYSVFSTLLSRNGTVVEWVFDRNPEVARSDIKKSLEASRRTAHRLGMPMDDVLDDSTDALCQYCSAERCWIALWTTPSTLSKPEAKRAGLEVKERCGSIPLGKDAQRCVGAASIIRDAHASTLNALVSDLRNSVGLEVRLLTSREAIIDMRNAVDRSYTNDEWSPRIPGDKIPLRAAEVPTKDTSGFWYPTLRSQIFPRGTGKIERLRYLQLGDYYYAPLVITIPQNTPTPFVRFYSRLLDSNIPYRISFLLEPGGSKEMGIKSAIASMLSFSNSENLRISKAVDGLRAIEGKSESTAKLRVVATTWGSTLEEAQQRGAILARSVQGWGQTDTAEIIGDPLLGLSATVPGITLNTPAPAAIGPLEDILHMLPFSRPASVWQQGSMLLRSPDGKILPFQPGSSRQAAWVILGFAPMGQGKSVAIAKLAQSIALSPGIDRLPLIGFLDIGPSSLGVVDLIRYRLPPEKRHLVQYHKLSLTPRHAINLFDLPLGLRKPLESQRKMLKSFLSLLATPSNGNGSVYDGIDGLAETLVDKAYAQYDPSAAPKLYQENQNDFLAKRVQEEGIELLERMSWYEISEEFFNRACYREATLAQRYAVPTLADCAQLANHPDLARIYTMKTPFDEKIIDFFYRSIIEAISAYPSLAEPTAFDLAEARIVSLDLEDVSPSTDPKQAAIMFMVAKYLLSSRFYLRQDIIQFFPESYRKFHSQTIKDLAEDVKAIIMDEFHRCGGIKAVVDDMEREIREGRKWKILTALFSQNPKDFNAVMEDLCSTVMVLGAGSQQTADYIAETFAFSPSAHHAILHQIKKPSSAGAGILMFHKTDVGRTCQLTYLTLGNVEKWAFSSDSENRLIRNSLYEQIPPPLALKLLAKRFPSGSAIPYIERLRAERSGEVAAKSIVQTIIDELATEALDHMAVV